MKIRILTLVFLLNCFGLLSQSNENSITVPTQTPPFDLTQAKIEDLSALCKVWGFLKYYHPSVREGKYNWDNELLRILPNVIRCQTKDERNLVLLSWIDELGKFKIDKRISVDSSMVKLYPNLAWIDDSSNLGDRLKKQLNKVKLAKRDTSSYYVRLTKGVGNPIFLHENSYPEKTYPDNGVRFLSLFRYWNIIEYYFPNRHLIGKNWDSVLYEFVPKFQASSNTLEYKMCALALISSINDTHADMYGDPDIESFKGIYAAPYKVTFIEDKPVITDYAFVDNKYDSTLRKGDIILKVDSTEAMILVNQKLPYTSGSNYPAQLRKIASDFLRSRKSVLNVTYQRDSVIKSVTLSIPTKKKVDENFRSRKDTCFQMLTSEIGYINPENIKADYIPSIMKKAFASKGLIIDLRHYPQESMIYGLGRYLYPEAVPFERSSSGSVSTPGLFVLKTKPMMVGGNNKKLSYEGKVILLINEDTQSHGEFTAMAFKQYSQTTIIGSTTAGADGNISRFYLPGGISTLISGIGIYYPDGKETQRVGILPDIYIKPTIRGIMENRDELLEKALEIINTK